MTGKTAAAVDSASRTANEAESARQRLLDAATELFCRYGINATGVDAVIDEAKTAKTTLYRIFGSKEGLIEAVLDNEGQRWRDWFINGVDAGQASSRTKLLRIFPLLKEWFSQERFYGCPFINAVGEHDKADERMRTIAIRHKTVVLKKIETLAADAGFANASSMAHQIGLLIDGAIIAAMVTRNPGVADDADAVLRVLIDNLANGKPATRKQSAAKPRAENPVPA
ncbi:TetR/AcrR family transcriptional regulator [Pseudorhodoplanes sinuspersici]|uniref:TetR family transcriptional regulator n=1 Tax=Pseudorhodoplanes sinuspersici TaxID=1235591 RepID=A0A1W6ZVF9_9HYPH|nr:TetR/AcrR family transcriptional regulator [Pseudorhodoplanes sinuspersici]ARQ01310.1 TetR family transcriptional regulator [Pseudorhodoplanes sinuspersici]RKE72989.1 TetR family transcriptional regulator [Pseudorhodoplanes sinuspersici]